LMQANSMKKLYKFKIIGTGIISALVIWIRLHRNLSGASHQSFFQEILGASLRFTPYSVSPHSQGQFDEGFLFALSAEFTVLSFIAYL